MERDREGFGEGGFFDGNTFGDDVGLGGFSNEQLLECALHMGKAHGTAIEQHVEAVVLLALLAIRTLATGARRADGNHVANFDIGNACAQFGDFACYFVAEHHGFFQTDRAKAAVFIIVQVRAAYAAALNGNFDLTLP